MRPGYDHATLHGIDHHAGNHLRRGGAGTG